MSERVDQHDDYTGDTYDQLRRDERQINVGICNLKKKHSVEYRRLTACELNSIDRLAACRTVSARLRLLLSPTAYRFAHEYLSCRPLPANACQTVPRRRPRRV